MSTAVEPDEIYGPEDHKPPVRKMPEHPPDGQRVVAGGIGGGLMGGSVAGPLGAAVGTIFGALIGAFIEEDEKRKREL